MQVFEVLSVTVAQACVLVLVCSPLLPLPAATPPQAITDLPLSLSSCLHFMDFCINGNLEYFLEYSLFCQAFFAAKSSSSEVHRVSVRHLPSYRCRWSVVR